MKQYLMLCDENSVEQLKTVFRSEAIQFLEVQGMIMQGGQYNILLSPVINPVNQVVTHTHETDVTDVESDV